MLGALKLLGSQLAAMPLVPAATPIVEQMNEVTDSAARLTRALLGFAQRTRSVQRPLDVNRIVESIATIARRTIDRRIELHTALTDDATDVVADESQLEQALFNLVLNARDAIEGSGAITLRTAAQTLDERTMCGAESLPPGKYVVVDVIDTGAGIPEEIRDRVFEPYFTTKTAGANRGTGLGLATAYGAVKRHGGGIMIAGTGPRGTTFRLYLPASAVPAARDVDVGSATVRDGAPGGGMLLLADDDPIVREASAVSLRQRGYDVKTAADGSKAVSIFRRHHHQLVAVVLDLVMPVMSGREALVAMRSIDANVPVIIATGSLLDERDRASLGDVAGLLAKPYGPRELTRAVADGIAARS
jgi:CheY-like chemotaxis protein